MLLHMVARATPAIVRPRLKVLVAVGLGPRARTDTLLARYTCLVLQTMAGEPDFGAFFAYCQTKSSTTLKALELMNAEVERIRESQVSDDELAMAKDSYINRYVFQFTSANQVVSRLMNLEYYNRPRDLLEVYLDNVRAVTKDD